MQITQQTLPLCLQCPWGWPEAGHKSSPKCRDLVCSAPCYSLNIYHSTGLLNDWVTPTLRSSQSVDKTEKQENSDHYMLEKHSLERGKEPALLSCLWWQGSHHLLDKESLPSRALHPFVPEPSTSNNMCSIKITESGGEGSYPYQRSLLCSLGPHRTHLLPAPGHLTKTLTQSTGSQVSILWFPFSHLPNTSSPRAYIHRAGGQVTLLGSLRAPGESLTSLTCPWGPGRALPSLKLCQSSAITQALFSRHTLFKLSCPASRPLPLNSLFLECLPSLPHPHSHNLITPAIYPYFPSLWSQHHTLRDPGLISVTVSFQRALMHTLLRDPAGWLRLLALESSNLERECHFCHICAVWLS